MTSKNHADITTILLEEDVDFYLDAAKGYYYGTSVIPSIVTTDDWSEANFSCHNLANHYMWVDQNS